MMDYWCQYEQCFFSRKKGAGTNILLNFLHEKINYKKWFLIFYK